MALNKQEFLMQLRKGLSGMPQTDIEERVAFYGEMIDDRMEEGLSENDAVSEVGTADDIAAQIISEVPLGIIAKERLKGRNQLKTWEIVLLVLGSPIWLSLGVAALAVLMSVYIVLWSVVISLWAVFVSIAACSFGCLVLCAFVMSNSSTVTGFALIGAGLVLAGLSIFMFYGCIGITKGIVILTKKIGFWIKSCLLKKEEEE